MRERPDVLVIGGGAIGVCCAYELVRRGAAVTLLEKEALAAGSSYGNAGLVTVSVASPLAMPGAISDALKSLLHENGHFRLRPRADRALAMWLWRFRSFCREDAFRRTTVILRDLTRASRRLLEEVASLDGVDFAYRQLGLVAVYVDPDALTQGRERAAALGELGIDYELLDAEAVRRAVPFLSQAVAGGIHFPEDAHLDPARLVTEVARLAESADAQIRLGVAVRAIRHAHGGLVVETTDGELRPGTVIVAAGAWSPQLVDRLGVRLPIQPAKGYSLTFERPEASVAPPIRLGEARAIVTQFGRSLRLTGRLDLVGLDSRFDERRGELLALVSRYLDVPDGLGAPEAWAGLRPLTPDGLPIIGRHPRVPAVVLATGHGMLGIGLAPITGRLVAELVAKEEPSFDLEPLRSDRFGRRARQPIEAGGRT